MANFLYQEKDVIIIDAKRTAIGSLNGSISSLKAHELGTAVIKNVLYVNEIQPSTIDDVIMGQVFTAGQGQNPARQASINAGLPVTVPATSINILCGSGLKAVAMAYQSIKCGDAEAVIAGGQESMSQAVHCVHMRDPLKFGDAKLIDTLMEDGLKDAFHGCSMGVTAENVAKKFQVSREDQDAFALKSQSKVGKTQSSNLFDPEIVPISIKNRKETIVVDRDEFPRNDTTILGLQKLKTPFSNDESASVTAGNASGINDGAAVVLVTSCNTAIQIGKEPLARIVSWSQVGVEPLVMGIGPIEAVRSAVAKANWNLQDIDVFEFNEAFAAQSLAVIRQLGVDPEKVNVKGGSIALGHPLGASGARILVTLLHIMRQYNFKTGVAALCVGGGMGIAMCVERL